MYALILACNFFRQKTAVFAFLFSHKLYILNNINHSNLHKEVFLKYFVSIKNFFMDNGNSIFLIFSFSNPLILKS